MDARLSATLREAAAQDDGESWGRAARGLLRAGAPERAAVAARRALSRSTSAMDVLDATTPALRELVAREVVIARRVPGDEPLLEASPRGIAWSHDGGVVFLAGGVPRERWDLLAHDLERGEQRWVAGRIAELLAAAPDGSLVLVRDSPAQALTVLDPGVERVALPGRTGKTLSSLSFAVRASPPAAFVADGSRAYAYAPGPGSTGWRRVQDVRALEGSYDPSGALAYAEDEDLVLHDPLAREPRVRVRLEAGPGSFERRRVLAAGRRALVIDEDVALHDEDGAVLARAALPSGMEARGIVRAAPSPSGGLLAFSHRVGDPNAVHVVELRAGRHRAFEASGMIGALAWSPSGRRLAAAVVNHDGPGPGSVLLLRPRR